MLENSVLKLVCGNNQWNKGAALKWCLQEVRDEKKLQRCFNLEQMELLRRRLNNNVLRRLNKP